MTADQELPAGEVIEWCLLLAAAAIALLVMTLTFPQPAPVAVDPASIAYPE